MAANNNLNPQWFPDEIADANDPRIKIWRRKFSEYVWELRDQQANLSQTVQNFSNNVNQTIQQSITAIINGGNNNNGLISPPVIYGAHVLRLTISPASKPGYIFIETDRFESAFFSNGLQWVAFAGVGAGSFENRWTGLNAYDVGLTWIETSRNNANGLPPYPTYRWDGANWNFLNGEFYRTQANLTTLANSFAPANAANGNDIGARVNVTDFAGQLQWANANNNNGWNWGPDDCRMHGMGPILAEVDPSPTTGWAVYDGNNYTYLKSDGTTGNVTLPNLVSANNVAFLQAGNVNSNINPAVAPAFTGNAAAGSINAQSFTGDARTWDVVSVVSTAGTQSVLKDDLNNNPYTPTGNISQANFTGNNVTGTVSNNGVPPNITRRPWFRK